MPPENRPPADPAPGAGGPGSPDRAPGSVAMIGAALRLVGLPPWLVHAVLAFAFGVPLLFVALGVWVLAETFAFTRGAFPVEATVLRFEVEPGDDGTPCLRPVLAFNVAGGAAQQRPMHDAATRWPFGPGDTVTALWNPARPATVRLPGLWRLYGGGLATLGLGLGAILIILLTLRRMRDWPILRQVAAALERDGPVRTRRRD